MIFSRFNSIFNMRSVCMLPRSTFCSVNASTTNTETLNLNTNLEKRNIKSAVYNGRVNEEIRIQGWVKGFRKLKEQIFLDINDGSTYHRLQVVMPAKERPRELSLHSSIDVTGVLFQSLKNPSAMELHPTKPITVVGSCDQKSYPFGGKIKYQPEYIRQFLHLRPKTNRFAALLRLRSAASRAIHDYFSQNDFIQIHTPILTSNDCEGAGETFTVRPDSKELLKSMSKSSSGEGGLKVSDNIDDAFFDRKTFLTVSSQLHLEAAASGLEKVWTFSPVFRAENCISTRHLSEFYMVEAEIGFAYEIHQILEIMESLVQFVIKRILTDHFGDWELYMRHEINNRKILENIANKPFTIMTFDEARQLLSNIGSTVPEGKGLNREQELLLVERINDDKPIFVINWPSKIKPFYMKSCEDNSNVAAVDLLVPNIGELCGGSLRENDLSALETRIQDLGSSGVDLMESLDWYLDLRRFGSVPTGGFGMGFDRILQLITGSGNIKDVSPFPRWPHNCPM